MLDGVNTDFSGTDELVCYTMHEASYEGVHIIKEKIKTRPYLSCLCTDMILDVCSKYSMSNLLKIIS